MCLRNEAQQRQNNGSRHEQRKAPGSE
jgi:hypothetical protein